MSGARHVVVVGAGITGLTTAYVLSSGEPRVQVTLIERRERVGGNIETERRDGFLLDGGPDSFLSTKREGAELCRELGLGGDLIVPRPEAKKVYMVHRGRLEPMPGGLALAIPTKVGPMLSTPLMSFPGKLRMLGDLVLPRRHDAGDESIEDFIARRFGREAARRLAAPLLGGIYAGDIGELSVLSTFPQLVEVEQKHGSLARGLLALQLARAKQNGGIKKSGDVPSPFMSLKGGMGALVAALSSKLPDGTVKSGRSVEQVERAGDGWRVTLAGGEQLDADAVVLASPAHVTAKLVPDERLARELGAIPYLSTATVFFALPRSGLERPLDGAGFVAPKGEAELIAGTWVSAKWDGRAPDDHVLVRAFLGGARAKVDVVGSSDEDLANVAKRALEQLMGKLGTPSFTRVFRYVDANPQPIVGHGARMARVAERLKELPGLYVAGAAYDGVGIPDCVRQARAVAQRVREERLAD